MTVMRFAAAAGNATVATSTSRISLRIDTHPALIGSVCSMWFCPLDDAFRPKAAQPRRKSLWRQRNWTLQPMAAHPPIELYTAQGAMDNCRLGRGLFFRF